jgi:hypothetical protein
MKLISRLLTVIVLTLFPLMLRAQSAADRTSFGKDMVINAGENVDDAICYFCSIRVYGTLSGDAVALGGGIEASGSIEGDALAAGGGVRLAAGARVNGDVTAVGGTLERAPQASVGGDVDTTRWLRVPGQRQIFFKGLLGSSAISLAVTALFYALLRRRRIEAMADSLQRRYLLSLICGTMLLIVVMILLALRIPLRHTTPVKDYFFSLALLIIFGAGASGCSYALGRILQSNRNPLVAALLGAVALNIVCLIPFIGFAAFCIFGLLALGIPLTSGFGKESDWLLQFFARRKAASPASSVLSP